MPRYIAIGGAGTDEIVLPDGTRMPSQCGGNAIYSAVGMRIWSPSVGIVSVISSKYPQEWIDQLAQAGIDVSGIRRSTGSFGLSETIIYQPDGRRVIAPPRGALALVVKIFPAFVALMGMRMWASVCPQAADIPESYLQAQAAHLAPGEYASQAECLQALHARVASITLDPPPLLPGQPAGHVPKGLADLSLPDVILPSEQELAEYFGEGLSPAEGVRRLRELGAKSVVVKVGGRGSLVFDGSADEPRQVPIYRTTAVDVTGAGDSYCGGFLVGLDESGDLLQAALYGTVSASFVVEGYGAHYALRFTRADAEARLQALRAQIPSS